MRQRTFFVSYYSPQTGFDNVCIVSDAAIITADVISAWQEQICDNRDIETATILWWTQVAHEVAP